MLFRSHLAAGAPCPVCEQEVARVPARRRPAGLDQAEARVVMCETAAEAARGTVADLRVAREKLEGEIAKLQRELKDLGG